MSTEKKTSPRIVRSPEFKEMVATNFALRLNDNLCELMFAYATAIGEEEVVMEQGMVILTPRSLKTMSALLSESLKAYEANVGEIALKPGKLEELKKLVSDSQAAKNPSI